MLRRIARCRYIALAWLAIVGRAFVGGWAGEAKQLSRVPRAGVEETYAEGFGCLKSGTDFKRGVRCLQEASEAGFAVADTDLGTLYAEGQFGVQQDYTLANYHLERGAEGGDSRAHFQLGVFKLRGKNGFPMDKKAAARHFRIAGEAGCRPALRNLSRMFATGDGIPQDSRMAVQCLVRAAEKSDTMQELLEKMRSGTLDRDTADKLQEHMERMRQKLAADPDFNPTADFGGM